jgi:hypothetical protein
MKVSTTRRTRVLTLVLSALFLFSFLPAFTSSQTAQAANCQTFSETGFTVCGKFLTYWQSHGGLTQQGFPISGVFEELNQPPPAGDGKVHKVQYFQRARFEEHLENQPPYDILLGLLGREQFNTKYPPGSPDLPTNHFLTGECKDFGIDGVPAFCSIFLEYWNSHGGLAQQGYPITDAFDEVNAPPPAGDGKVHRVQYFERARFEEHTEKAQPYNVLLGLLGTEQYQAKYAGNPPTFIADPFPGAAALVTVRI